MRGVKMNQSFSKTDILILVLCIIAAAAFALNYFSMPKETQKEGCFSTDNYTKDYNNYTRVSFDEILSYGKNVNDVINVKTRGKVVGVEYDDVGGSILLSDNAGNYLWVSICHACIDGYKCLLSNLKQGAEIEVSGTASYFSTTDSHISSYISGAFNISQPLPETIGAVGLDPAHGIRLII